MNLTLIKELLVNKKYTDLKNELLKGHTATASGPLVTSIADIAGVMIYFSIAAWYLQL